MIDTDFIKNTLSKLLELNDIVLSAGNIVHTVTVVDVLPLAVVLTCDLFTHFSVWEPVTNVTFYLRWHTIDNSLNILAILKLWFSNQCIRN